MKRFSFVVALAAIFLSAFVPSASAQPDNWIYGGQAVDTEGISIVGAYGNISRLDENGDRVQIANTVTDYDGHVYLAPEGNQVIGNGQYVLTINAFEFLTVRRDVYIADGRILNSVDKIVMKAGLKDTGLNFDYNPQTRELQWSFLVRGREVYTPSLRVETLIWSPATTKEYTQFAVRQGQDYFGGSVDSYENKMVSESLQTMSVEEQELWHPEDLGVAIPKIAAPMNLGYANYLKLPASLPSGQYVCGNIVVYRTGDPTNVRSNSHGFCVRLEPTTFRGRPVINITN
ncbi:MAG: hypothetical protein KBB54_02880 [Candidatus Pacebacteria bacterium]|nr:hypothetical protein [Candidatus Paceibacterota bacterium]